jgi:acyl carrier protein
MMPDGFLIHLGRKDLTVKVRGHRVELEEVERRLLEHRGVKDAALAVRDRKSGEKCLVAYLVSRSQPGPTVDELRGFLRHKLPDYMIPSAFMFLDSLPLTANGKVDRQVLPGPGASRPELDTAFVSPRAPLEKELAQICAEVLSLDQVGIHDDFFELGAHSLLAMQIISQINDAFRVEVPLRVFWETPTVEGLAELIETLRWARENAQQLPGDLRSDEETGEL